MTQSHEFFHQFHQVARHINKKVNERLSPQGIYSSQWTIIYYLKQHGPTTLVEISNYLNVEAPTVTRTANRLEKIGWVKKVEGKDKREKRIQLSELALENYSIWKETVGEFEKDVMAGIAEHEKEMAFQILQKMMSNMKNQR